MCYLFFVSKTIFVFGIYKLYCDFQGGPIYWESVEFFLGIPVFDLAELHALSVTERDRNVYKVRVGGARYSLRQCEAKACNIKKEKERVKLVKRVERSVVKFRSIAYVCVSVQSNRSSE